jgi:multiple sugar transport system permease protein
MKTQHTSRHIKLRGFRGPRLPIRNFNTGWLFILPAICVFLLFKYYPILMGMFISFFNFSIMNPPGNFVGFGNYFRAFRDPLVINAVKNNLSFWLIMIAINMSVPLILAVMVDEVRKHKTIVRTLYYIPAILPSVVVTVLWKYIWQPDYGLANYFVSSLGGKSQLWLNDINLVKWCMRFPYTVIMAGLSAGMDFIIYLAALNNISKEMYESAQIDSASFSRRLFSITLPNLRSTISMLLVINTINIFNLFDEVMIMTGGGPARASETLVLYAFQKAYQDMDYSYAITITTISFLIVFLLTIVQIKAKSGETD